MSKGTRRKLQSCFPYLYALGFLKFIHRHRDRIDVITYDELDWGQDYNYQAFYPEEHRSWKESLKSGQRSGEKVYLILQHDVDQEPNQTHDLISDEQRLGIRSNVMVFNRKIDRRVLSKHGEVVVSDYEVDWQFLRSFQQEEGFVIGYHCNAYERAGFDRKLAEDLFLQDVKELRRRLEIRYFSPHGGVRDQYGVSNASLDLPGALHQDLRWVHNRYSIRLDAQYSDGALNGKRDPEKRDLRDFVRSWKQGRRYRILIHPQYYGRRFETAKRLSEASWYREIVQNVAADENFDPWESVQLAF